MSTKKHIISRPHYFYASDKKLVLMIFILCLTLWFSPAYAQSFSLKETIEKDLLILQQNGHHGYMLLVKDNEKHDYEQKTKDTMLRDELEIFRKIANLNISEFPKQESSSGNLKIKQWTLSSIEINTIKELTYREQLTHNEIHIKLYIIEQEQPPSILSYLSVNSQGLIRIQRDARIIDIAYEAVLVDLHEGLGRFEGARKQLTGESF